MKKYALLVGVEEYRDKMISRLNFARADATALAERLSDRCGFDSVRVLAGESSGDAPDLVNIVTALRDMAGELRQDDLILFFFAGHGVEKDGHGYLLARDSLQAFPEHGSLSLELLRKTFEHLVAAKRLILVDACRNCPDAGRANADGRLGDAVARDIVAAARTGLSAGTTTVLFSACRSGQRAYEHKEHGVFSHFLIEGLDGDAWEGDRLDFRRLASHVSEKVREWSAKTAGLPVPQEPWYEEFGSPDSLILASAPTATRTAATEALSRASGGSSTRGKRPPSKGSSKTAIDPQFLCPVCNESADASDANLCPKCNKYVHHDCQKCIRQKEAWDWSFGGLAGLTGDRDTIYTYACPTCGSKVRKERN